MALSATVLKALIKSKVDALKTNTTIVTNVNSDGSVETETRQVVLTEDDMYQAIAEAVVEHITSFGIVTVPPGVAVTAAGPPGSPHVGATTAPGIGTIS